MKLWLRDELYSALTHALEDSPGLLADLIGASGEKSGRLRHVTLHAEAAQRITAFVNHLGTEPTRPYFGTLSAAELKEQWNAARSDHPAHDARHSAS